MSGTRLMITALQLMDPDRGIAVATAGGAAFVTLAGSPRRATLFNPDTGAALSQPVALSRGNLRFAVDISVLAVDIYGFAPDGGFFVRRNVKPGQESEINYSTDAVEHVAVIPMAIQDYTANVEVTTGLQFPAGALLLPNNSFRVTTLEGSRTIEIGLLSSESGGDADGLIDALSLAAVGTIAPAVSGTPTLGALLVQNFGTTPAVNLPDTHAIGPTTARTISVTFGASTAAAQGFFYQPFIKPAV